MCEKQIDFRDVKCFDKLGIRIYVLKCTVLLLCNVIHTRWPVYYNLHKHFTQSIHHEPKNINMEFVASNQKTVLTLSFKNLCQWINNRIRLELEDQWWILYLTDREWEKWFCRLSYFVTKLVKKMFNLYLTQKNKWIPFIWLKEAYFRTCFQILITVTQRKVIK